MGSGASAAVGRWITGRCGAARTPKSRSNEPPPGLCLGRRPLRAARHVVNIPWAAFVVSTRGATHRVRGQYEGVGGYRGIGLESADWGGRINPQVVLTERLWYHEARTDHEARSTIKDKSDIVYLLHYIIYWSTAGVTAGERCGRASPRQTSTARPLPARSRRSRSLCPPRAGGQLGARAARSRRGGRPPEATPRVQGSWPSARLPG